MTRLSFPRFSAVTLAVLGGCIALAAVFLAPFSGWERAWVLPVGFLLGLGAAYFAPKLSGLVSNRTSLLIVLGATFFIGLLWLAITRVSPEMFVKDFSRQFETAKAFAAGTPVPEPDYQAVFPHLLGYPFVLSLFFRLFGASVTVAQGVNLFFSVCVAFLLFSTAKKLMGQTAALAAGLFWALLPQHFMLLSLVGSEPLYILLSLCAVRMFLLAYDRLSGVLHTEILVWMLLGLVVGLFDLVRPLGPIYLLAFILIAAIFAPVFHRRWLHLIVSALAMIAVYTAVTQAGAALYDEALDRPAARNGFGWNLYVGMNRESAGGWNAEDYEVMRERLDQGLPASEIQRLFRQEAFERLKERLSGFPRFMANKFTKVWSQDSFTVYWLSAGMRDDSPLDIRARAGMLSALCNLAYGLLLGCCAFSLFRQVKSLGEGFVLPVTILIGVVILFLLLEANPRYHYAGSAMLCLLAAGCVIPKTNSSCGVTER
ncbi:MAG: glycosyltransferase family 39 protein [Oscillospiraceae bacterium]|nr:glycosyltransferase family 39 protein [Oscillospiraceae bacterium]